ncbi:hypothetical protein RSAG8_11786, partial [Rhizoctonia solani AG-8 WAC10335]
MLMYYDTATRPSHMAFCSLDSRIHVTQTVCFSHILHFVLSHPPTSHLTSGLVALIVHPVLAIQHRQVRSTHLAHLSARLNSPTHTESLDL